MQTHLRIAHLAFQFGAWHERSNRIDDDNVDCSASNQDFGNFQGLLAAVGLRDEEIFNVDAELARIIGVEGVLRVHEGRRSAKFLRFGDNVQRQSCLAAGFRSEDFDDTASWKSADAESRIQRKRPRRDRIQRGTAINAAEPHDGPFAELFLNLRHSQIKSPTFFGSFFCHKCPFISYVVRFEPKAIRRG